jgi:hypothetical protein
VPAAGSTTDHFSEEEPQLTVKTLMPPGSR